MFDFEISPFLAGLMTSAALIIAIGPQNAFVLKQGLLKNQMLITTFMCSLADAILICIGVAGVGNLLTTNALLMGIAKWGGAVFLLYYGFQSFYTAFKKKSLNADHKKTRPTLKKTVFICFALSFLNPHAVLDTTILLGSISTQYQHADRLYFTMGAMSMSFIWFFVLCYGARFLEPIFKKPKAWQVLDIGIGIMMWIIALSLIF